MKNRLVFRILGALASALIIVSVFIPFVSITGYTQSIWQSSEIIKALYLPIMIIVFGAIGVLAFATNIKTELAYASSGALLFYIITQVIPFIEDDQFSALGVGFYCLAIGTILTGVMAFICNLKVKVKDTIVESSKEEVVFEQNSVLDQIDKLYNDQAFNNNEEMLVDNGMNSIPMVQNDLVQPYVPIEPLSQENMGQPMQPMNQGGVVQPLNTMQPLNAVGSQDNTTVPNPTNESQSIESTNSIPMVQNNLEQPVEQLENTNLNNSASSQNMDINQVNNQQIQNLTAMPVNPPEVPGTTKEQIQQNSQYETQIETTTQTVNPTVAEFSKAPTNPTAAEFEASPINPTVAEFGGIPTNQMTPEPVETSNNPVTAEFENGSSTSSSTSFLGASTVEETQPQTNENNEAIDQIDATPLSDVNNSVDIMASSVANKNSDLDIFG